MKENATQELYDFYRSGQMSKLGKQIYEGLDAYFQREGKRFWTMGDAARLLGVTRAAVRSWLKDISQPSVENLIRIGGFLSIPSEMLIQLSGRSTLDQLRAAVEKQRFDWQDGEYIWAMMRRTLDTDWKLSSSPWKRDALAEIDGWVPTDSDRVTHAVAYRVARFIDAWRIDRFRDRPIIDRQVAMSA
jgi:transcriptional regulator with XRE-family HTH domain